MFEPSESPKKLVTYAWIAGVLCILSVCLIVITVSNSATTAKNAEALIVAQSLAAKHAEASVEVQAAANARERSLLAQIEALSASVSEANARQRAEHDAVKLLKDSTARVDGLSSELKESVSRRRQAEADLVAASHALREANAKASAAVARVAELEADNRRLVAEAARPPGAPSRDSARALDELDKWIKMNDAFLAKVDADVSVKRSASGLRYKVIAEGHPAKPRATSSVKCRYEGRLVDGKVFDTTKFRGDEPAEFPLAGVIPAWTEGLQQIGAGGKILLYCPPALAFGSEGQGPIPGNSVLIFEVELVEVTRYR
jgi:FKBP-type peptidyl-prolyl cis-trans isomerase